MSEQLPSTIRAYSHRLNRASIPILFPLPCIYTHTTGGPSKLSRQDKLRQITEEIHAKARDVRTHTDLCLCLRVFACGDTWGHAHLTAWLTG